MSKKIPIPEGFGDQYRKGMSVNRLAEEHGISPPTVMRMLRELGIELRPANIRVEPIPGIGDEYLAGASTTALAKTYKLHPKTIAGMLRELGVPVRKRGRRSVELAPAEVGQIKAGHRKGQGYREVAATFGKSNHLVRRVLNEAPTISPHRPGRRPLPIPPTLVKEWAAGANYADLGRKYKRKPDTIKRMLKRAGANIP